MNGVEPTPMYVNGELLDAYIIGSSGKVNTTNGQGKITIEGTTVDLINAIDAGFYASSWKGQPTAMTVNKVNVWFPDSNGNLTIPLGDYQPLIDVMTIQVTDDMLGSSWLAGQVMDTVMDWYKGGIKREGLILGLTKFARPQRITFNGIVSNNFEYNPDSETIPEIFILDENPVYKELGATAINKLFDEVFTGADFEGLSDIINKRSTPKADVTAKAMYESLASTLKGMGELKQGISFISVDVVIKDVFDYILADLAGVDMTKIDVSEVNKERLIHGLKILLSNLKVQIEIATYPYAKDAAEYGTKGNPKLPQDYGCNPIVFWGLDMTTAEERNN